ncbi:MAG TPA: hypothetical protein VMW27_12260 [Thermoanaerobaculia bacterium]|nr:hypothetical protein [Thermoanaerobaculia bacterium]
MRIEQALSLLIEDGPLALVEGPRRLRGLPAYEALLLRSWELRLDDPPQAVELAKYATLIASKLKPRLLGDQLIADLCCRAWAVLSNAYRVAGNHPTAESTLETTFYYYYRGSQDELLFARIADFQASLLAAQRDFDVALELLTVAHKIYCDHGEPHLAGRALISRGIYEGYAGDRERGIQSISEGLRQIDKKRDPRLAFLAVHNLAFLLVEGKRFREARVLSRKILWHSGLTPRRIDRIKLLWIEGRANLGLGRLDRAARDFQAVRTEFLELEMHYQAALAALDLALVDLLQNRTTEARATVLEAVEVFCALEISQEQLNAVNILKEAFKRDVMAAALLEMTLDALRRAERDPS